MALFNLTLDPETRRAIREIANAAVLLSADGLDTVVELRKIREQLRGIRFCLARPGPLQIRFLREDHDMIQFKVVLPPVVDTDVVSRELSVQVADGEPTVLPLAKDQTEAEGFEGPQDADVSLSLVDIDDAGNRSEASTLDVTLADTFPPAAPGELSIVQTGEVNE